jgi:type VI secretion system secreted protein VgrG
LSKVRLESLEAKHNLVRSSSHLQSIVPGGMFALRHHPQAKEIGVTHVVVQTRMKARVDNFRSDGSSENNSEPAFQNEFTCIPAKTLFRPEQQTPKPIVEGPQTAVVVGPAGEEIYVDEYGRVKCHFHWDRLGKRDQNSSCWIRVSQLHAGKNFGAIDIPRIGEEVIVSFLNGDPDYPIITGRVFNGANPVPFGLSGDGNAQNKTRNGRVSKTYKGRGYNEISMDDTAGKEQLRVQAQHNMNTTVNNDQTLFVGNNQSISVVGSQELTIGKTQTVTIGGDQSIGVGGKKEESIALDYTLSVGGNWTANAKGEISFTGDGGIDLICGGSVVSIQKDNITMISSRINLIASSEVNVSAGGTVSINGTLVKINC